MIHETRSREYRTFAVKTVLMIGIAVMIVIVITMMTGNGEWHRQ